MAHRKSKSTYEKEEFVRAYNEGLSNYKLASMFGMERKTVTLKIKELILPPRPARKSQKATEPYTTKPVNEPPEPEKEPAVAVIEPKTSDPKISDRRSTFILPPTLRQLEKEQNNIAMQRAKRNYMILKKKNGFSSLINQEIDNSITSITIR